MSLLALYLIFVLPSVAHVASKLGVLGLAAGAAVFIATRFIGLAEPDNELAIKLEPLARPARTVAIFGACLFMASAMIPSERAMFYIIGGYAVTNIEGVEKLGPNFVGAANAFLEQYQAQEKPE